MVVVAGCGLSLLTALLSVRLHEAGFSAHAIGFNTAMAGAATLVGAPLVAPIAKRIGVARLLLGALVLGGSTLFAFAASADYLFWLVLRFIEGACATVLFVLSEFWITSRAPARRRGMLIGIYVACLAAGFASGPLIVAATNGLGLLPFAVGGALFFAATAPMLVWHCRPPELVATGTVGLLSVFVRMPVTILAATLHGAIEIAGMAFLPLFGWDVSHHGGSGGLYAALFVVGNAVLQLPIAALADRVERLRLLVGLAVVGLIGAVVLYALSLDRSIAFAVVLFGWGGIVGAFYPVGLGDLGRRFKDSDLASANSSFVMSYALGMLVGPPIAGIGFDLAPPGGFFLAVAVLIAAYLAVAISTMIVTGATRPAPHLS